MKWTNESHNNPGYTVWHTSPDRDPNILYVIRQKKATPDFKPVGYRVFVRTNNKEALRTIFMDDKLKVCKTYVEELENARTV